MDDIFAVRVIGKNFLTCVNGEEPTESQITTFVEVAKRGKRLNHTVLLFMLNMYSIWFL